MLVWKQGTREITDRLIWRLQDSIIHLDEKGILLSKTEKNPLLSFSWQRSETRGGALDGKWECHYSCCQGHSISPMSNFLFGHWASMGFVVQCPKYTTGTAPPLLSPPSIKASDLMGHQWNSPNRRISASLGSWDCEPSTIPAGL